VLANAVFQLERTSDNLKGTDDDEYYDVSSTGNFKGVYYTDASQSTTRGLWGYTAESNSGSSDDSAPAYRAINGNAYTDTDGVFVFYGLPDGYYELTEVKAPDGYNTLESITFKIYEGKITESSVANLDYTSDVNPDYNAQTLNLVDESGFTLPSTGGVGDYLIYILGGVGILGAASMWMFVKRRQTARRCCTRR
jgi:LPXTG-motif cell wall-anchored protein